MYQYQMHTTYQFVVDFRDEILLADHDVGLRLKQLQQVVYRHLACVETREGVTRNEKRFR
jgi:predicted nucleic acid-binding Zn ribbon protein